MTVRMAHKRAVTPSPHGEQKGRYDPVQNLLNLRSISTAPPCGLVDSEIRAPIAQRGKEEMRQKRHRISLPA